MTSVVFWATAVDWRCFRDLSSGCFPLGLLLPQQKLLQPGGRLKTGMDVLGRGWERVLAAPACGCRWKCLQLLAGLSKCSALRRLVWAAGCRPDAL